ncbi:MAG: hypothetical protein M3Z59_06670, partial [Bombella apis]|nr:hypothetical protein [Bombella apis]
GRTRGGFAAQMTLGLLLLQVWPSGTPSDSPTRILQIGETTFCSMRFPFVICKSPFWQGEGQAVYS